MANLLPPEVQRSIFNRMLARVALVTSVLLSLVGGMAIAAVLPAYITLTTQQSSLAYEIAGLNTIGTSADIAGRASVSASNKRIRAMQAIFAVPQKLTDAIDLIDAAKPKGMTIEHIGYDPGDNASSTERVMTISGIITDQNTEDVFLNSLRSDSLFTRAEIPISTLANADKNAFTIVMHGNF
jgi:hypothetical protein